MTATRLSLGASPVASQAGSVAVFTPASVLPIVNDLAALAFVPAFGGSSRYLGRASAGGRGEVGLRVVLLLMRLLLFLLIVAESGE